jgi:hypothetical protein
MTDKIYKYSYECTYTDGYGMYNKHDLTKLANQEDNMLN